MASNSIQLVDSHCHLTFEPLLSNIDQTLKNALENNVTRIIVPAYDLDSWNLVARLTPVPGVYAAFGLHPWKATQFQPTTIPRLAETLHGNNGVAMGEIGLDFKMENPNKTLQMRVLRAQLELAVHLDLPVLFHVRGAFDESLAILREYSGKVRGVIHAFSRGPELARQFVEAGMYLGFGGTITSPHAKQARKSAAQVPMDRILLETDAPSMGLHNVPPENTEPKHIRTIAQTLATLRGVSLGEVAARTTKNAMELFAL